jgi:hypothetical protein
VRLCGNESAVEGFLTLVSAIPAFSIAFAAAKLHSTTPRHKLSTRYRQIVVIRLLHQYPSLVPAETNTYHYEDMRRINHSKIEKWISNRLPRLESKFAELRRLREMFNYLGLEGDAAAKLRVVRGHGFGFDPSIKATKSGSLAVTRTPSFFARVDYAKKASKAFLKAALRHIESHTKRLGLRHPKWNDANDEWFEEYLGEDFMLWVIPHEGGGTRILSKATDFLKPRHLHRRLGPHPSNG